MTQPRSERQPSTRPGPNDCWQHATTKGRRYYPTFWRSPTLVPRLLTTLEHSPHTLTLPPHQTSDSHILFASFLCYPSCPRVPPFHAWRPSTVHLAPGTSVLMMPKPGQKPSAGPFPQTCLGRSLLFPSANTAPCQPQPSPDKVPPCTVQAQSQTVAAHKTSSVCHSGDSAKGGTG